MPGKFKDIAKYEGRYFRIEQRLGVTRGTVVLAIHGGRIEQQTDVIASGIAGKEFSYYALIGGMRRENKKHLHIASEKFDDPRALKMVEEAERVISIHGEKNTKEKYVMLGGRDSKLKRRIEKALKEENFIIKKPVEALDGKSEKNICNRGQSGAGVQLEISKELRDTLSKGSDQLDKFVRAIRGELGISTGTGNVV